MHTTILRFAGRAGDSKSHFDRIDDADVDTANAALAADSGLVWVDVADPTAEEFAPLARAARLDRLAVEDALTKKERPKSLRYGDMLFVAAYTITDDGETSRISMFLLRHALLTVRLGSGFDIDSVADDIADNSELLKLGPRALQLLMLDAVVDGYTARVSVIDEQVDDLESILFDSRASNHISQRTFELQKVVAQLRHIVLPMRDVVGSLQRHVAASPREHEMLPLAEDVYDHIMHAAEWTEGLRDNVESIRSTNLSLLDNQLNTVMKKLSGWAAIIAVPTAITGYFGQNVPYPGFGKQWGFWVSIVMMLVLGALLYVAFKRRGWL